LDLVFVAECILLFIKKNKNNVVIKVVSQMIFSIIQLRDKVHLTKGT